MGPRCWSTVRWWPTLTQAQLEKKISKLQKEMRTSDADDDAHYGKDRRGDELPPALWGKRERLARLETAKFLFQQQKLSQRAEEEQQSGRKKTGRKPAPPPEQKVNQDRKANTTDPESRIMKTRRDMCRDTPRRRS